MAVVFQGSIFQQALRIDSLNMIDLNGSVPLALENILYREYIENSKFLQLPIPMLCVYNLFGAGKSDKNVQNNYNNNIDSCIRPKSLQSCLTLVQPYGL